MVSRPLRPIARMAPDGGLGFGVLGSYFGFLGLGLSVDGVWGLWCGAFWVFLVWALYINMKE